MIYRDILEDIKPWLPRDEISILKEARHAGKTTILTYLQSELKSSGREIRYIAENLYFADPTCTWTIFSAGGPKIFSSTSFIQYSGCDPQSCVLRVSVAQLKSRAGTIVGRDQDSLVRLHGMRIGAQVNRRELSSTSRLLNHRREMSKMPTDASSHDEDDIHRDRRGGRDLVPGARDGRVRGSTIPDRPMQAWAIVSTREE